MPRVGLIPKLVAALAVVALAAAAYAFWPQHHSIKVTGEFTRAVGLFPGSDVRILGVKVGRVTSVTPIGDRVRVVFEYDDTYKVPADAKAAVVAPSLVSDRYVQLLPAYTGGPVMRDGARIGLDRTAVPVELDRISSSLDDLLVALGPNGANKNGAFSDVLKTGAANLAGQGQNLHDTNRDLSLALQTLSGGRNDLFGTVKNLQAFTSMLATNDTQVRRLNSDLASVSVQLDGERDDLAAALKNLAVALDEVSTFVHDNRAGLTTNLKQLASVTGTVAKQRDALAEALTNAPVALSNLQNAYNPKTGTLDTRANINENLKIQTLLCNLIVASGQPASVCKSVDGALKPVTDLLGRLKGSGVNLPLNLLSAVPDSQTSQTTSETTAGTVEMRGADPTLGGLLEASR
jgi:phospholipid/cholesterol/gamma-HCH transport system substrate-binding protein